MIPRFGRVIPFAVSALGIVDTAYMRPRNIDASIFIGAATAFLVYFMFKNHAAVSPKRAISHIVIPFLLMATILASSWFIFF
jgi:hypothetical protein